MEEYFRGCYSESGHERDDSGINSDIQNRVVMHFETWDTDKTNAFHNTSIYLNTVQCKI